MGVTSLRAASFSGSAVLPYGLIVIAKVNDVDPHAWLADVLAGIAERPVHQIDELLPWNWRSGAAEVQAA